MFPFLVDVAFAIEDLKVWDVGLPPNEKFIGRLLQEAVKIDPVGCMTCGVDGFRPKSLWDAIIIQHCSCKSDQGPILPLHHSILLGCVRWWEFMLDANVIAKLFNLSISKLRAYCWLHCSESCKSSGNWCTWIVTSTHGIASISERKPRSHIYILRVSWEITSFESPNISTASAPTSKSSSIPLRTASYSTKLLVHGVAILMEKNKSPHEAIPKEFLRRTRHHKPIRRKTWPRHVQKVQTRQCWPCLQWDPLMPTPWLPLQVDIGYRILTMQTSTFPVGLSE